MGRLDRVSESADGRWRSTAAARGRAVPHRRRDRDHADLPRRARPAPVRGLPLLDDERRADALRRYYRALPATRAARRRGLRAGEPRPGGRTRDWGAKLGYTKEKLDAAQPQGDRADGGAARVATAATPGRDQRLRRAARRRLRPGASSCGRRGARSTTSTQIATFGETGAEMVTAITMTYVDEAIGIAGPRAAAGMPGRRSRSRSRPTAGCRAASRCGEAIDAGRRGDRRRGRPTS